MDKIIAKEIREKVLIEAKKIAESYGLVAKAKSGSYSNTDCTVKMEFAGKDEDGLKKEERDFIFFAESYGLKKEDLGKTFTHNNKVFKIVGLNARNSKFPILLESNGRSLKAPIDLIKFRLEGKLSWKQPN